MIDALERAAAKLRAARSVVVFTGAGVSAESGLPTFRSGANATWSDADVARYATPHGYRRLSRDAWQWYGWRARLATSVQPNPGHLAIVEIERRVPDFLLVTQNIDGLHHRAGSRNVVELHGSLRQVRCFDCSALADWPAQPAEPVCGACGGLLRPDVVFFEEALPAAALERACAAATSCAALVSVGTSNVVWPAAGIPDLAYRAGADVIIVNPDTSGHLRANDRVVHLRGLAGDVLPRLTELSWNVTQPDPARS